MSSKTLEFYERHAERYAMFRSKPSSRLLTFLGKCKPEGDILELGAGAGVEAAEILSQGFKLYATDGSVELAKIASTRIGQTVRVMRFMELSAVQAYDGVYANASLTHAPRSELPIIFSKVYASLKVGGVFWASFKAGCREDNDRYGRHYNFIGHERLASYMTAAAPWAAVELESWLGTGYDQRQTHWVAVTAVR
ncbi:class I SAM-dependent methyltransferase [Rhodobacteraceae bacterium RKSG542]|uniref:class I SAM-dependent methyltransferase n=1 Tax=Pseudovibrio flavus TaxID=2529854 RepID=UPI0012BD700D|nr:class I SAM-dependent methyltransferase [Pseudovibrio flavus]MTI18984.1 class I SAM-dependent methyltransferase [Pseudovibrio flavus]